MVLYVEIARNIWASRCFLCPRCRDTYRGHPTHNAKRTDRRPAPQPDAARNRPPRTVRSSGARAGVPADPYRRRKLVRAGPHQGRQGNPSGLGPWPKVTIKAARQKARILLGRIADGEDPVATRQVARAVRQQRRALPTVAASLALWRAARAQDWSPRYAAEVTRLCEKILEPAIGARILADTRRAEWIEIIAAEREARPATATWLYAIASSFANYAETAG